MKGALSWEHQPPRLILRGDLDRETLLPLWNQRRTLMNQVKTLDVAGLQRVDSAGLAMLVHLRAQAEQEGVTLALSGITDRLSTLIALYNLQEIIPVN
ncbi:lipid asymmetry maintenance protein MlaB [Ewingella americana]|uniref:Lipid asymmetry maintenance protein MlaB n=1 Tax=Ewingella americana TaxID=41202 RepID=A0A502GML7_9GAMM|nr:lipid asymmetry maintenance protein MlaB [Ewingella americana]TPG62226.1 lipid asymmetry maintenance protein MlaB [Ewingella americana]